MQGNDANTSPFLKKTRPTGITIFSIFLLLFSLFQLWRVLQVILLWEILSSLDLSQSPLIQGGEGLLWAVWGFILAWGLWKGKHWAHLSLIIASLLFTLVFWIKLIWIAEPVVIQTRWPFSLGLTIIGLGSLFGFLRLRSTQGYLGGNPAKIT
jgi:hypothetical protein